MVIIELRAENFKRLKAVRIRPEAGKLVRILGKNGAGKSSILDAIAAGLGGADAVPPVPVRVGEKSATVYLDLGDYRVTRTMTEDRVTRLVVTDQNGKVIRNPQQVIDQLLNDFTLDPMQFMLMRSDQRLDALKKLIPDFDFAGNERARREAYDTRRDIGRDYRRDKALLDSMPPLPDKRPETVDPSEIVEQLRDAEAHNHRAMQSVNASAQHKAEEVALKHEIEDCRRRIAVASARLIQVQEALDEIEVVEPIETAELHNRLAQAETFNRAAAAWDATQLQQQALDRHQAELRRLDDVIEGLDEAKRAAVRSAQLPVDNLTFGADDVEIAGLPFVQASSSQQLMVSTALTMAMRPTIKVILVREGPLLDEERICLLAEVAHARGYQVWLERLLSGTESGIIIEDGEILDEPQASAAARAAAAAAAVPHAGAGSG